MSTREITGHLEEIYGVEVSPTLISNVTDAVKEEVTAWQNRPIDAVYPILYLDALYVKIRDTGHIQNRAIYVAIGVNMQGRKEVLGLWMGQAEGAKFWLQVLTELNNRGLQDIFIACVDGLKGFPEAIETVFPKTQVQLCIVHLLRASLNYVSWKQRKQVAADLKPVYRASTAEEAQLRLEEFAIKWDRPYPTIAQMWRRNWEHVTPFFGYPAEIRKVVYTTNAIDAEHVAPQGDQDSRFVPKRGGSDEVAVHGIGSHRKKMDDAGPGLEGRLTTLRDSVRGSPAGRRAGLAAR
jgi:putative transposase